MVAPGRSWIASCMSKIRLTATLLVTIPEGTRVKDELTILARKLDLKPADG